MKHQKILVTKAGLRKAIRFLNRMEDSTVPQSKGMPSKSRKKRATESFREFHRNATITLKQQLKQSCVNSGENISHSTATVLTLRPGTSFSPEKAKLS